MNRATDILSYLPDFLTKYKEIGKIAEIENEEINEAKAETLKILDNFFIDSCDKDGIVYFEKLYGVETNIVTDIDEHINERKNNCAYVKKTNLYAATEMQLKKFLEKDEIQLIVDYSKYTVYVGIDSAKKYSFESWVNNHFRNVIPANLKTTVLSVNTLADIDDVFVDDGDMTTNKMYSVDENANMEVSEVFIYIDDSNNLRFKAVPPQQQDSYVELF